MIPWYKASNRHHAPVLSRVFKDSLISRAKLLFTFMTRLSITWLLGPLHPMMILRSQKWFKHALNLGYPYASPNLKLWQWYPGLLPISKRAFMGRLLPVLNFSNIPFISGQIWTNFDVPISQGYNCNKMRPLRPTHTGYLGTKHLKIETEDNGFLPSIAAFKFLK